MTPQFLDPRLPDRFWSKCIPEPNTGCWLWIAAQDGHGYGAFGWRGASAKSTGYAMRKAYQYAYVMLVGAVPSGLELDHLCRNHLCCNPAHLEPVTHAENLRRARVVLPHCPAGHAFTEENTMRTRKGHRKCRVCDREWCRLKRLEYKLKARAA